MVDALETVTVTSEQIFCDGGNDISGHPRVYLKITAQGSVDCSYCGRRFVLDPHAPLRAAH